MSIPVTCSWCSSANSVDPALAGTKTECAVCGHSLDVPAAEAPLVLQEAEPALPPAESIVSITCPSCGHSADAQASFLDREAVCPQCNTSFDPKKPRKDFTFREQSRAVAEYRPRRADDDEYEEDDRPRRRRRRTRRYDRYSDEDSGYRCPYCNTSARPVFRTQISTGGWITFALLLFFCWPLFWIGLLITEEYAVCSRCGIRWG